jgi:hypothetical protein
MGAETREEPTEIRELETASRVDECAIVAWIAAAEVRSFN